MFLPYVYIVTNRSTKQFYIGMRSANKVVAEQDLGIHYFTSSKKVKENFEKYDITILAYFADQLSAFEFENQIIKENWDSPLLLNKHYQKSFTKFSMTGAKREDLTDYNRKTKSKPKEVRKYTCIICCGGFDRLEFIHKPAKKDFVCGHKCNGVRNGKSRKGKSFPNLSAAFKGRTAWNKGVPNPNSADNARKGAKKLSEKATGRRRQYKEDGSWTWIYSEKDEGC